MFKYDKIEKNYLVKNTTIKIKGENNMKHKHSKIGEYGIKWESVEGYKTKEGKKIPPHYKKVEFKWKQDN